jgi:hypothetical protein
MAVQLFVLIGLGAWLGQQADKALDTSKPYFTILLILLFLGGFFYKLNKDLNRKHEP